MAAAAAAARCGFAFSPGVCTPELRALNWSFSAVANPTTSFHHFNHFNSFFHLNCAHLSIPTKGLACRAKPLDIHLCKEVLRAARSFKNLNFRDYFVRRAKEKLRELRCTDTADAEAQLKKEIEDLKRQATITNIYHLPTVTIYK